MDNRNAIRQVPVWCLAMAVFVLTTLPAQAQKGNEPSDLLSYKTSRLIEDDGYMVAGDLWNVIKPMNTNEVNKTEDNLRNSGFSHYLTIGPDGGNWLDPGCFWPGGYHLTTCWRDGMRLTFPVFESAGFAQYGYTDGNPIYDSDGASNSDGRKSNFMFAYYSPNLQGAGDPARDYKSDAHFTDDSRTHLIYEAGWPTTTGIDFQIRGHQYTSNEQNLNDFLVIEITMTNTGVLDVDGDGTPEATDHVIEAIGSVNWNTPTEIVRVLDTGNRNANLFGAGRTVGYSGEPDANGVPADLIYWFANVPAALTTGRATPPPGTRFIGVNDGRFKEGYIDLWNSVRFMGVKQGKYSDGLTKSSPDKPTLFGSHSIGEGTQTGWYASMTFEASLGNRADAQKEFRVSTATWYNDYGKTSNNDTKDLSPNPAYFSGGTADDVTTFVVGDASARPNGDTKYASVDVGQEKLEQPLWEPRLNAGAADGSDFYAGVGHNWEFTFGQDAHNGIGPYSLAVGESITIYFAQVAGYRAEGVFDAYKAAEWAWERNWDISADMPTPATPDILLESNAAGGVTVNWTDSGGIAGPVDGYKIWRAAQYKRIQYLDDGFRLLDNAQHLHEVGGDNAPYRDEVNPWFDAPDQFVSETQGVYQPAEWGTYDLIAKIPSGGLSEVQGGASGYDYSWDDEEAIVGFTYWYYVSAYREGSFSGPQGTVSANHIESSNWNRNGRNSPNAAPGELGLVSPWGGTYPFADRNAVFPDPLTSPTQYQNMGHKFTVTPPAADPNEVASLITVSPNPYKITGLNDVRNNPSSHSVDFLNLPADYTLTIVDVSGQIILQEVAEGAVDGKFTWDLFSKDGTEISSGLYIYHVSHSAGEVTGHFAILR